MRVVGLHISVNRVPSCTSSNRALRPLRPPWKHEVGRTLPSPQPGRSAQGPPKPVSPDPRHRALLATVAARPPARPGHHLPSSGALLPAAHQLAAVEDPNIVTKHFFLQTALQPVAIEDPSSNDSLCSPSRFQLPAIEDLRFLYDFNVAAFRI